MIKFSDMKETLYMNSGLLMLNTLIMTGFGFIFWTINARLFDPKIVGIATTLISAMMLIANFSNLGMGNAIIRFVSGRKEKSRYINTSLTIGALVALMLSAFFILMIPLLLPEVIFIKQNIYYALIFIVVIISWVSFNLLDSVLISFGNFKWILIKNSIFSIIKIILPFLFVSLGVFGIFGSWGLAAFIGMLTTLVYLVLKMEYGFKFAISDGVVKKIAFFSVGNHLAGLINQLPNLLLPLIIIRYQSPENTAFFYVSLMIAGLLFIIPNAIAQSLFAEGSHSKKNLQKKMRKATGLAEILVFVGIILVIALGKYVLFFLREEYTQAYPLLVLLSLSSVFITIRAIRVSLLNIQKRVRKIVLINSITTAATFILIFMFIDRGLSGIGIGWLLGQSTILLIPKEKSK